MKHKKIAFVLGASLALGALSACVTPQGGMGFDYVVPSVCAKPREDGKQLTSRELLTLGKLYLDTGLQSQLSQYGDGGALNNAVDCYGRALRLAPDSYEGNLNLGVTYTAKARATFAKSPLWVSYLASAKRLLGQAYALRQGPYEPLYYLAEIAALEEQYELSEELLLVMDKVEAKSGPVNALLGFLAEKRKDKDEAQRRYEKALQAGWPNETLSFVVGKVPRWRKK